MSRNVCWLAIAAGTLLACGGRDDPQVTAPPSTGAARASRVAGSAPAPVDPATVERVPVAEARARVQAGRALLVCAYEDARCAELALEGSIPWSALQARLPGLPRDQEIILFCS